MKAIIWTQYGPPEVLKLMEIEKPSPKKNEVLIKVLATTVTAGDCELRRFDLPGWIWLPIRIYMGIFKPRLKILGQELAGEIESVGSDVDSFKKGDLVFTPTQMKFGSYAEYICLPSSNPIATMPSNMTFAEAATIPTGGLNALHFLRKGKVRQGESILINGAGGSIGTYAVQIAKAWGAKVTCVDTTKKLEMLKSIGADHVIDYTKEDFTENGNTYDVIIDVVCKGSLSRNIRSLRKNGRLVIGNPKMSSIIRRRWVSLKNRFPGQSGKKVINALTAYKLEDMNYLKELIEEGKIKAVIDKSFPLNKIVEAHHYVENGHKLGNVVINLNT